MTRPIDALPQGWRGLSSGLRGGQARSKVMRLVIPRKLRGLAATVPVPPLLMATIGSLLRCCQHFLRLANTLQYPCLFSGGLPTCPFFSPPCHLKGETGPHGPVAAAFSAGIRSSSDHHRDGPAPQAAWTVQSAPGNAGNREQKLPY